MTTNPTNRLFFALWPDASTRQQCQELVNSLACNGKPVATQNLHVTLVFLGNVDSQQQLAITQAASGLSVPAMALQFDQLSYWQKPAIGCLTTSCRVDSAIVALAEQLAVIAERCGIAVDKRPFTPHVTLFRKLKAPLQGEFDPIQWCVSEFCLVESCASADGVLYRVLNRWSGQG
jgi:2'-5' RNA ligase